MNKILNRRLFSQSKIHQRLIQTSLDYVPKYGWSQKSIHMGCSILDLSPASHRLITPYTIITHCMNKWNQQSLRQVDDHNFSHHKKIRDKIAYSIQIRLRKQIPYIDCWHQAMAIGAHPNNFNTTRQLLWNYSDEIWIRCGDRSVDSNYYTKRILFNSVYISTELFMLTDQSHDKFATWQFLSRRLNDVEDMGKGISDLKIVGQAVGNGILSLFTMFQIPKQFQHPIEKYKQEHTYQNNLNQNTKQDNQNQNKQNENQIKK